MSKNQLQALIQSLGNVWSDQYNRDEHSAYLYPHTNPHTSEAEGEEYPYTHTQDDDYNTEWYSI